MESISDAKRAEREEIERQTQEFLNSGGEVEIVPDMYAEYATGIRYGAAQRIQREIKQTQKNKIDAMEMYRRIKDKKAVCKKFRISEHTLSSWIGTDNSNRVRVK